MAWDLRDASGKNVMVQSLGELSSKMGQLETGPASVGDPLEESVVEKAMAAKDAPEDAKRATLSGATPTGENLVGFTAKTKSGDYDVWDEEGTYLGYLSAHNSGRVVMTIPEEGADGMYRGVFYKRKVGAAGLRSRRTQKRQPKRRQGKQEQTRKRRVRSHRNRNRK